MHNVCVGVMEKLNKNKKKTKQGRGVLCICKCTKGPTI